MRRQFHQERRKGQRDEKPRAAASVAQKAWVSLTFIKLNKANINRCDSLSEMVQNQDLISIGSLVLVELT